MKPRNIARALFSFSLFVLLAPANLSVAQDYVKVLEEKVRFFSETYASEKAYLHLDRPTYLVGETIWFKMSVTQEDLHPSLLSTIGYIEVINSEKQTAIQAKVALKKGKGNGALQIPTDIPSGNYLVRGYTNWMKNFSSHFYEGHITIINPFVYEEPITTTPLGKPDLRFFPEGGQALTGVDNKIGFKAEGPDGKGLEFKGKIIDETGKIVTEFSPLVYGIGHFIFRPEKTRRYQAEIEDTNGNKFSYPFQDFKDQGYSIRLLDKQNQLELKVHGSGRDMKSLFLLHYKGAESTAYQIIANNGESNFTIPKSKLHQGVNALTLFDSNLVPVAGRLYYHHQETNESLLISASNVTPGHREKLSLDVRSRNIVDTIEASVSVFLTDSLPELAQASIGSWFLLSSELKGQIENPDYYFSDKQSNRKEALDNLLLTHGWRRYDPEKLTGPPGQPEYLPEMKGHFIKGRVVSADGTEPRGHRPVFAAYPSEKILPWVSLSDDKGEFLLQTNDFTGAKELVVQTNFRMDSTSKIVLESPFLPVEEGFSTFPPLALVPRHQADILKRSINMQTQNSYFKQKLKITKPDSSTFYGAPDFNYYLDHYTRFPTMEEILSEYVPAVSIRRRKGKYYTRVFETGVHKQYFTEDPLLMIDGIPVFDTDRIIHFDPLKIKKVDVVNRMYYLGPLVFPGIVSYSTYTHDLSGFEVDPRALIMAYEGTLQERDFYQPAYDRKTRNIHRRPDFRNLMYWNPSVKIVPGSETKLDFYTSDQKGSYRIVIQGLSEGGIPVSATSQFEVGREP